MYEGILESFEARYHCGRFAEGKTGNVDLPLEGWHLLLCLRALRLACQFIANAHGLSWEDSRGKMTAAHPDHWLKLAQSELQQDCERERRSASTVTARAIHAATVAATARQRKICAGCGYDLSDKGYCPNMGCDGTAAWGVSET